MSGTATAEGTAQTKIEIFRRSERDREALESMYAEVFGPEAAERNRARFRWQYEENPHCPPEGPEIWVARENGVVLGQYATMPVRVLVKGRILRGSWGMDVMVRPNLQRKGIGSRLFLFWDQQVEASLGLGLSMQSYTLFRKLQWEDVGPVPCYSKVLDPMALLSRRLPGALATLAAPLLRAALWLVFPTRRARGGSVRVRPLEGDFGPEYDALWEEASQKFDFVAERKPRYLQWKFREPPHVRYDVYEARRGPEGELEGYVVLRTALRNGVRLALLVDLFCDPEDEETLDALLDRAIAYGHEASAARLQCFTFDRRIAGRLLAKGFFLIPSPMQFCVRIKSGVGEGFFRDTSRWHVSFGDSDQDREL
ncbi:MAG TPA: GNAT family N-acetyltransferase [Vicinamibacteria bacterium]|jgi:GNAT superfamily N-acetyltransferase